VCVCCGCMLSSTRRVTITYHWVIICRSASVQQWGITSEAVISPSNKAVEVNCCVAWTYACNCFWKVPKQDCFYAKRKRLHTCLWAWVDAWCLMRDQHWRDESLILALQIPDLEVLLNKIIKSYVSQWVVKQRIVSK